MASRRLYRVTFLGRGQVYELYARSVSQGALFGFVEIEGLTFGERSQVVVDPGEESLKREFEGVERIHVPMHAVIRIDEVERPGVSRMRPAGQHEAQVTPFPSPIVGVPPRPGGPDGAK